MCSLQLWGTALAGCAGGAAMPGLLQHCSSSAGSRQLPEIKGKTFSFSTVPWCSKAQGVCPAELPRDRIHQNWTEQSWQSKGLWLCRFICVESPGKDDFFIHLRKCLQCQVSAQSPALISFCLFQIAELNPSLSAPLCCLQSSRWNHRAEGLQPPALALPPSYQNIPML